MAFLFHTTYIFYFNESNLINGAFLQDVIPLGGGGLNFCDTMNKGIFLVWQMERFRKSSNVYKLWTAFKI